MLDTATPPNELERVVHVLQHAGGVRLAIVFGSCAKGKQTPTSDLDIAVALDQPLSVRQHVELIEALALATGRPIDLVDLRTVGEPLLGQIVQHGVRILGSDVLHAQYMTRHVMDAADFMPCQARILLESLRRCLSRIESKQPFDADQLASDFDLQDIVSLNLTRAVQLAVDIGAHIASAQSQPGPATMGETFDQVARLGLISSELARELKKSVGFRNIAVHNYSSINWQVVHAIAADHLRDFDQFALAVSQWQSSQSSQP